MGWSELDIRVCNHHPDHRQQPGVCSCCLREKLNHLSQFSDPSRTKIRTLVAVSSASASSGSESPVHHHRHRRHASTGGSLGFIITNTGGLKKSRSIAFIATNPLTEHEESRHHSKGGFWKKLIRSTGKGTKKVLMHSRTVRQKAQDDLQF
ncbi:hypothetical protein DCAR_0416742 [Daucus carota subsp. sativus]|uniref:Uncharacterized protein n=1 Tax=Daucus carota subsp. sativus TaxID=79200 RepID=A0A165XRE0_DAUCS|nr:hypothetical protein DCAR_0416742 [Daucus carota subsp. sativus]